MSHKMISKSSQQRASHGRTYENLKLIIVSQLINYWDINANGISMC